MHVPAELATEDLWYVVHGVWSEMLPGMCESPQQTYMDTRWATSVSPLKDLNRLFVHDKRFMPHGNLLSIDCPVGDSLLYSRPSLRLIHSTILMLLILAAAHDDSVDFNIEAARDIILRSHAHLFNSANMQWKVLLDETLLHQCFPATIPILIAASELTDEQPLVQNWVFNALYRCAAHGWTMGLMLLKILMLHSDAAQPKTWPRVGAQEFLARCRSLERPYVI